MKAKTAASVTTYIEGFPPSTRKLLKQMRAAIRKAAPTAAEKIGYGIPTFTLRGNLVHFAGYTAHIGFYPGAAGVKAFEKNLGAYKHAKGSIQFPLDKKLPLGLVTRIVKFRVKQNLAGQRARAKKK